MRGIKDVSGGNWQGEVLNSKDPVIVNFWHEQCAWCKRLEPELDEVAGELAGKVTFVRLNILSSPRNTMLSNKYGVMSTPTLIMFCHGRIVETIVGFRPKEQLKRELQDMLDRFDDCLKKSTPLNIDTSIA